MENEKEQNKLSADKFYTLLSKMKAISPIYEKIIKHLVTELEPNITENAKNVIYVYFSLLEDGNTRIPLDVENLYEKWMKKWEGLVIQENAIPKDNNLNNISIDFKAIFETGINDLLNNNYSNIIGENKLFIIKDNYLYANKYYEAKLIIEEKFKQLFYKNVESKLDTSPKIITNKDIEAITQSKNFKLNDKQLDAVNIGQNENIIITGGPGTGKTTVVFYILWFLLNQKQYSVYKIYLTAPSGKASDRVKESLLENLNRVSIASDNNIITKLSLVDCYTIHRLLKYNPVTGKFKYNKDNKFDEKSIFVIDEASMIDISMFANLLEAISDKSRIFILGDIDQLPSVDAGAVLGDLLNSAQNVVELTESKRFTAGSNIGKLKEYIYKIKEKNSDSSNKTQSDDVFIDNFNLFNSNEIYWKLEKEKNNEYKKLNQVKFISLIEEKKETINKDFYKNYKANLDNILTKWIQTFFYDDNESICEIAEKVNPLIENSNEQDEIRDRLWKMSLRSKILCAEKQSITGLNNINRFIYRYLFNKELNNKNNTHCDSFKETSESNNEQSLNSDIKYNPNSNYFPGQLLIITRNQGMYKLYNGDTGIVVVSNDGADYLMVKKNKKFEFYPLTIFPKDSIENAFAITVHKSQGSEYGHILMFLPNISGHRVLSNQIIYTGITRAKDSVTIVSTKEAFDSACSNVINRDTGIVLL